jgi:peroxiredoxin
MFLSIAPDRKVEDNIELLPDLQGGFTVKMGYNELIFLQKCSRI